MTERTYRRRSILGGIALGLGSSVETTFVGADSSGDSGQEIIVGLEDTASVEAAEKAIRAATTIPDDATVVRRNETVGYLVVRLPPTWTPSRKATAPAADLDAASAIAYAEPNDELAMVEPVARTKSSDSRSDDQYAPQLIRAPQAHQQTHGSPAVTVAVIDTGVDYDHPDLDGQFTAHPGRDVIDGDDDPRPEAASESHGTHVSGLLSAERSNDVGIDGTADATLLAGRIFDRRRSVTVDYVADAIQWATDRGADLINLSLSGHRKSRTVHEAVRYAVSNGTLPICAAGNMGYNRVAYPARHEECVAVTAIDSQRRFWPSSQYGPNVDVCAPGVAVLSTTPDGYEQWDGTSMAAPIVTGVAALALAVDPTLSPRQLRDRLVETAVDVGLPEEKQGGGRVDAKNVVEASLGSNPYPVLEGFPFESEIRALVEAGVLAGYPDETFHPEGALTRAEFAAMIAEALPLDVTADSHSDQEYPDVAGHWAETNIRATLEAGLLAGYPDGTVRPDREMRRVEVLVALANGCGYDGGDPEALSDAYDDADRLPDWARKPVANAHAAWDGIATYATEQRLEPYRPATRGEAAKYVSEAIDR